MVRAVKFPVTVPACTEALPMLAANAAAEQAKKTLSVLMSHSVTAGASKRGVMLKGEALGRGRKR
jgi:hypothetical protein